ncbi:MAG: DUF481 domain-containing protein [Deltaproteobacteria bacterium]|nr:DUF481 domain-containing protein [Deltaproteobacteria bacterium]
MRYLGIALILCSTLAVALTAHATMTPDFLEARTQDIRYGKSLDLTQNEFTSETRLGLTFQSGNVRALAISSNNHTTYRRQRYEHNWRFGAFYDRVFAATSGVTTGTTAQYIFGTYRFDYYFAPRTTIYLGGGGFTDQVKGIDIAGQGFTGLSHYFLYTNRYHVGGAVGYEYLFEDRIGVSNDAIHSATSSLFGRYAVNPNVECTSLVEVKQNVEHLRDFRMESTTDLTSKILAHLAIVTSVNLRFDNQPVEGFHKLDTRTSVTASIMF